MKVLPLAAAFLASIAFGQEIPGLLAEGRRAYTSGDLKKAKEDFQMILAIDPANQTAATYLRMIAVQQPANASKDAASAYAAVIIPKIDLRDATLGATLIYLKQTVEKQTEGKTRVNFVVQIPPDDLQSRKVTLKLENVPFTEVLRYVGDMGGVTFNYEKYAVTVKDRGV